MKKMLKVPLYVVFGDANRDEDDTSPFPSLDEMIAYLRDAVILDLDYEEYGECEGAACECLEINWDKAVLEDAREDDKTGCDPDEGEEEA